MKKCFIIQYWPEYNDRPKPLCIVSSQVDAEEMILAFYEDAPYESYLECLQYEDAIVEDFFDGGYFKYDYFYKKVNMIE